MAFATSLSSLLFTLALALALALAFLSVARCSDATSGSIIGNRETCDIEGEEFIVNNIQNTRCFNCICKNGFVGCSRQQCPSIEGCYTLLSKRNDECCHTCKGCTWNDVHHDSGTEWTETNDPCRIISCNAGVITKSEIQCYTPCSNPIPAAPGQCCPTCADCYVNGQEATDERTVTIEDPCVTCRCKMGRLTCTKQACPVLHCPASKIEQDKDECCPRCTGSGQYLSPPRGACVLGTILYESGAQFLLDECTHCTCTNTSVICTKETCPVLECANEYQTRYPHRCCPECSLIEESRASCSYGGKTYGDGESWKLDPCKACACMQGKVRCAMENCPPLNSPCPPNSRLEHPDGQCCPRCVESDGVCTVFGDPHYRTFDGKFFSFKGACKYQLASDCESQSFSIRVTNDARSTRSSAWTKTIALKIGDMKVNLGQRMRVKVNGKRIDIPYRVPKLLEINKTEDTILVSTHLGIKILWDGISFVEVSAPTIYRGRLCGLCGNFNSLPKDDFTTPRGRILQESHTFGQSWAVGGKRMCSRKPPYSSNREHRCRGRRDRKLCNRLMSTIFESCHKKVNPSMYYKACLQDMCECPTENCNCESFMAYVHECQRLGIQLLHWRKSTKCHTVWETTPKRNIQDISTHVIVA